VKKFWSAVIAILISFSGITAAEADPLPEMPSFATPVVSDPLDIKVGNLLHVNANQGSWPNGVQFTYQWLRDGAEISGATTATHVVNNDDLGHHLSARVTGSLDGYESKTLTSARTQAIAMPEVAIVGQFLVGKTVTTNIATPQPGVTYSYLWFMQDFGPIYSVNARTFKIPESSAGKYLVVKVTATESGRTVGESFSAGEFVGGGKTIAVNFTPRIRTVVLGLYTEGSVQVVISGNLNGASCVSTWYGYGSPQVNDPTTYNISPRDVGKTIKVKVECAQSGHKGTTKTLTSAKIRPIMIQNGDVTVSGTFAPGATLTAVPGDWAQGASFAYQWYRDGKKITGAKSVTYNLPATAVGHNYSVKVTGSKLGYESYTDESPRTLVQLIN
jgi:hypothetical protein